MTGPLLDLLRSLSRSPGLNFLVQGRIWVFVFLAAAQGIRDATDPLVVPDLWLFTRVGSRLFTPAWIDVFEDAIVQVGPLYLLTQGLLGKLAAVVDAPTELLFGVLVQPLVIVATIWTMRGCLQLRSPKVELAVGGLLLVWQMTSAAHRSGHPLEFIIPLLWLWAISSGRDGAALRAGALLGAAGGLKLWGLLGVPLLFLLPEDRKVFQALAGCVLTTSLLYGPFLLFGAVSTFDYEWLVVGGSGPSLFFDVGHPAGWEMRAFQGAVVLIAGTTLALATRHRPYSHLWAVALFVVGIRLLTDPTAYWYYWLAPQALLMVGAAAFVGERYWGGVLCAGGLCIASIAAGIVLPVWPVALTLIVFGALVAVGPVRPAELPPAPPIRGVVRLQSDGAHTR